MGHGNVTNTSISNVNFEYELEYDKKIKVTLNWIFLMFKSVESHITYAINAIPK